MTDPSTRGRRARQAGHRWNNEALNDLSEATGLFLKRQLREVREGNIGDGEVDPRLPILLETKNEKRTSPWRPHAQAREAVGAFRGEAHPRGLIPVAALRRSRGRGRPALRVAVVDFDDLREMVELHNAHADTKIAAYTAIREGARPRWIDALEEAEGRAQASGASLETLAFGTVRRPDHPDLAVLRWDSFVELVGRLTTQQIW